MLKSVKIMNVELCMQYMKRVYPIDGETRDIERLMFSDDVFFKSECDCQ